MGFSFHSEPVHLDARSSLLETSHLLSVAPHQHYYSLRGTAAVLHTRTLQRLSRLRQVGLGALVWPNAENTRFSHSLGTEYWVTRFLHQLRQGPCQENRAAIHQIESLLGDAFSLDLCARLFALVHDTYLLPLGHTLQYQLGFFSDSGAESRRLRQVIRWIAEEVEEAPEIVSISDPVQRRAVLECLRRHLDLVDAVVGIQRLLVGRPWTPEAKWLSTKQVAEWASALSFIYDLTHAIFSADLIDFALRDSLGAAMPQFFDERLLHSLCILETEFPQQANSALASASGKHKLFRFGLIGVDGDQPNHALIASLAGLYRIRYEIASRVFYHPTKCAADAMLDLALRRIDAADQVLSQRREPFSETHLLRLGDDAFLDLLESREQAVLPAGEKPMLTHLLSRQLHGEVLRLSADDPANPSILEYLAPAQPPYHRTEIEKHLLAQLTDLSPGDLIVSVRPRTMQAKPPAILLRWKNGVVATLGEIAATEGLAAEVLEIQAAYQDLWSASVYLHPRHWPRRCEVRASCQGLFRSPLPL